MANTTQKITKDHVIQIAELLMSRGYGETVSYSEIEQITGLSRAKFMNQYVYFRRRLKEYVRNEWHADIATQYSIGYYIIDPAEITNRMQQKMIRAVSDLIGSSNLGMLYHKNEDILVEEKVVNSHIGKDCRDLSNKIIELVASYTKLQETVEEDVDSMPDPAFRDKYNKDLQEADHITDVPSHTVKHASVHN